MAANFSEDTIAALSTPAGEGGIGIIRLSGRDAVKIAAAVFILPNGKRPAKFKSRMLNYGYIIDDKKKRIDEVLLTVMKAPGTYTREDIVEINCHGGITAIRKVLELAFRRGARPAEPGEFTKRAFLNGRLDLSQAEAVLDIIRARTEAGLRVSLNQLEGELSREVKFARKAVMEICADIEASMDFPEEDIAPKTKKAWLSGVKDSRRRLEKLLSTYHDGAILKEGIVTVICGRPNVGKSSLLNALLRKNRAIVTHLPGTTRDPIEETASIRGIPMRLVDTAGIRREKGIIEKEGIKRSRLYLSRADLILCVLDGSEVLKKEDREIMDKINPSNTIAVINKCDLEIRLNARDIAKMVKPQDVVRVSCRTPMGIDKLENRIYNKVWSGKVRTSNEVMVNNIRHKMAIEDAVRCFARAEDSIEKEPSLEFSASDLREGASSLGRITGEEYAEDLLDIIFSKFCVGK